MHALLIIFVTVQAPAKIQCEAGTQFTTRANYEYCVTITPEGKTVNHGAFAQFFKPKKAPGTLQSYPNVKVEQSGSYNMGLKSGLWTTYDESGNKIDEERHAVKAGSDSTKGVSLQMPPNRDVERKVLKLNMATKTPAPIDPCEPLLKAFAEQKADQAQLLACMESPEAQQYARDREAYNKAVADQLRSLREKN